MVRGPSLRFGLAQVLRMSWDWPLPSQDAAAEPKGDLVVVAFVEAAPVWQAVAGREERRTTALVIPLEGRDLRHKEGGR